MHLPKVAATAQLADARGTHAQRQALAYAKTFAVCQVLHDSFLKGEAVTLDKLKEIITPQATGIDYVLKRFKKQILDKSTEAQLVTTKKKSNTTGFSIQLPTKNKQLNQDKFVTIAHELFHFFSRITTPKISARENIEKTIHKQYNKQTVTYLAVGITTLALTGMAGAIAIPFAGSIIAKKLFPNKIFDHYKRSLYEFADKKINISELKKTTQKLLKQTRLKDSEKIDIIQSWRYNLKDEQNAYTYSLEIVNSIINKKPEDRLAITTIKAAVNNDFAFDEKIAMTEDLLKDEITAHRRKRRQKPAFSIKNIFQKLSVFN